MMRTLRRMHLYLGCLFAPLLIYFALSGSWQLFRLNDLPKGQPATRVQTVLHEWSKPHTNSTAPGNSPKESRSALFNGLALLMGIGLTTTSVLGVAMAFQMTRQRKLVVAFLVAGVAIPIILLLLK